MSRSSSREEDEKTPHTKVAETEEYPGSVQRTVIMTALFGALFLVNLDQSIISTAIPRITDEFHSLDDVAWYGSAYLLTICSFQLLMGKIYKFYPAKPIFLASCTVFEIGSAICGAAPSSVAFIIGRSIAGLGASGIFAGVMVIMFHTIPLQKRPIYQGAFAAVYAIASVIGPLVGGLFTDKVTWRWCFYINLPIGGVSIIVTILILHLHNQKFEDRAEGFWPKVQQLDPIGNLVFLPGVICLILALQWGGTRYNWGNARIIVLLIVSVLSITGFIGIQIWKKEKATLPPRLLKQRSVAGAVWFGFVNGAGMVVMTYYLPIWFQAVKNASAVKSGIMLLPLIISTTIASLFAGWATSKIGYTNPFFLACSVLMPIGAGLMTTFTISTGHAKWIGYQILFGFGLGLGVSQAQAVVQTVLDKKDMSTGAALVMFTRFMGSAIFLPVAENIFLNRLVANLRSNLPGIDPQIVIDGGATDLRYIAPGSGLNTLLTDYNNAIVDVFYMVVATSAATILGSIAIEWVHLKTRAKEQGEKVEEPKNTTQSDTESGEREDAA